MIPIKLVMENFASHQHSVLDFTKFSSALIIGAKNGNPDVSNATGKTTIFRAIFWVLFGKSDFSTKEKVVRRGKSVCTVEFTFSINDVVYKIIRKLNKKSNTVDVNFSKKDGREWVSKGFTGNTPTMTNRKIEDIIGMNYETGINSLYFRQNDTFGFAGSKATNRKEILKEILNIGMWDAFQQDAKDYEKKLNEQRDVIQDRLVPLANIEEEKDKSRDKLAVAEIELEKVTEEIGLLEEQLKEVNVNLLSAKVSVANEVDIQKLQQRITEINSLVQQVIEKRITLHNEVKHNNKNLQEADNNIRQLEKQLLNYSKSALMVSERINDKIKKIFSDLSKDVISAPLYSKISLENNNQKLIIIQRKIDEFNLQLKQLLSLEPGKECPICLSNIQNLDEVIAKREEKKIELINCVEVERNNKQSLEIKINEEMTAIKRADEAYLEIERIELIIAKFMNNISECHRRNVEIQKELVELARIENKYEIEKTEISNLLKLPSFQQKVYDFEHQKTQLERQITDKRKALIECGIVQGNMRGYLDELERRESEKQVLLEEDKKLSYLSETYKKLGKAFGKDGIQAIIMENVTEDLKDYANSILRQVCSEQMSVNFVTQRQTGTGSWKEDFDIQIITKDSVEDFDDISGGEQVRIAIALRLALSQLLMNRIGRNIQFLLLDEVDRDLDRHGIDALADVVCKLSKRFKILVITHNELMKEKFEHILIVQKGTDGSILKQ